MDGFTSVFGGAPVQTSEPSYALIALTANTQLFWPVEADPSGPVVASQIDVAPSATGLMLAMPQASSGSTGVICCMTNVGTFTFTLTDSLNNPIIVIQAGQSWIITMTSNAVTVTYQTDSQGNLVLNSQGQPIITNVTGGQGVWRATQLGSTTSIVQAAGLAGAGLEAVGAQLETVAQTSYLDTATMIGASYQSKAIVWRGGAATLQFDSLANLGAGWFIFFTNEGTGTATLSTTGGAVFNGGAATLTVQPGNSGLIVASQLQFDTFGFLPAPLPIVNGGTGATTAPQALTNLGGTAIGQSIFTAASQAAVLALLGGPFTSLTERSVFTPQTLTAASSGTMFVAGAAIPISVPPASSLSSKFVIGIFALAGAVTFQVPSTDSVPPFAAGVAYTIPQGWSALIFTDGVSDWYVTLSGLPVSGGTITGPLTVGNLVSTGNVTIDGSLTADGAVVLNDGLSIVGSLGLSGGITAGGGFSLSGNAVMSGNVGIGGTLGVTGTTSLGVLVVGSTSTFSGTITAAGISATSLSTSGTLNVTGGTGLSGNLTVSGVTTCNGNAFFNSSAVFAGTVFFNTTTTFSGSTFVSSNLNVTGSVSISGSCSANNFVTTSDARAKSEIVDITAEEGVTWVMRGRPRRYIQDERSSAGFIAQEDMDSGRGAAVHDTRTTDSRFEHSDGYAKAWHRLHRNYLHDIAYLTRALQVALERIEALEARLENAA